MSDIVLSKFEKQMYNMYLAALGKANNRPFRARKNFDDLEDEKAIELRKLTYLFQKYGEVDVQDFFDAPFQVHDDDKYHPLDYYNSKAATNAYTRFKRQMQEEINPELLIEYTRRGLKWLLKYCVEHKITIDEYVEQTTDTDIPLFMLHLKQHKINFFIVHALEIRERIYKLERGWRELYVSDFDEIFRATYKTFTYSSALKEKTREILKLIQKRLREYEDINV